MLGILVLNRCAKFEVNPPIEILPPLFKATPYYRDLRGRYYMKEDFYWWVDLKFCKSVLNQNSEHEYFLEAIFTFLIVQITLYKFSNLTDFLV